MSSYPCLGIHPIMLGHRGHFFHSSDDMPIHVVLPTCPTHTRSLSIYSNTHTHTHTIPPSASDPDVRCSRHSLSCQRRGEHYPGNEQKGQMKQTEGGINALLPYLLETCTCNHLPHTTSPTHNAFTNWPVTHFNKDHSQDSKMYPAHALRNECF